MFPFLSSGPLLTQSSAKRTHPALDDLTPEPVAFTTAGCNWTRDDSTT